MSAAWPPCPSGKNDRHEINVILPDTSERPALLFCCHCGMSQHKTFDPPIPLDDMTAEDILRAAMAQ